MGSSRTSLLYNTHVIKLEKMVQHHYKVNHCM